MAASDICDGCAWLQGIRFRDLHLDLGPERTRWRYGVVDRAARTLEEILVQEGFSVSGVDYEMVPCPTMSRGHERGEVQAERFTLHISTQGPGYRAEDLLRGFFLTNPEVVVARTSPDSHVIVVEVVNPRPVC